VDLELAAANGEVTPPSLAKVPLDLFALIACHRPEHLPHLRAWLPLMPPEWVQRQMTGSSGEAVILEAAAFVRAVLELYGFDRTPLKQARILDYGIGWARVARLFYKFTPTSQLHGVDAWQTSLQHAQALGFRGHLALIDPAPAALPFEQPFDLVYAFSVFTHLPQSSALAAIKAIRGALSDEGLLVLTVRPREYWTLRPSDEALVQAHDDHGFAFRSLLDGHGYGDASISLDYIRRTWTEFELVHVHVSAADPYQIVVGLRPR
jgi:hypothetical protein